MSLAAGSISDPTPSMSAEQYASVFANHPQTAPAHIRRAFADHSPSFPNILDGLDILMKGDALDKMKIYRHRISDAVMKLAYDEALYQSRELRTDLGFCSFQYTMLLLGFITQTFELLLVAIKWRYSEYVGHCERMLNLAPKLFRVLWDHRKLLRYNKELRAYHRSGREHDPAISFPQITGSLVVVWTMLHRRVRSRLPPIGSLQVHLSLFIWTYGPKYDTELQNHVLAILGDFCREPIRMDTLIKGAISSTDASKILPDDLVSRLIPLLRSPQELDRNLRAYAYLINVLGICPDNFPGIQCDGLAEGLCIACERQLCSGDIKYDDIVLEVCLRDMILLIPQKTRTGVISMVAISHCPQSIILLGRGLIMAAEEDEQWRRKDLYELFAPFLTWDVAERYQFSDISVAMKADLSRRCRIPWNNIHTELQVIARRGDNIIAKSAVRDWEVFGSIIGLSKAATNAAVRRQQVNLKETMKSGGRSSKDQGCCWHGCGCTGIRPRHPMRMCKGCRAYMYCSKKCQKKDWIAGHRSICTGLFTGDDAD